MRLLFVSAFYPPYEIGGWESHTKDWVDRLNDRGHEAIVITSTHGPKKGEFLREEKIRRILRLENNQSYYSIAHYFFRQRVNLNNNLKALRQIVSECRPQAMIINGMWNLSWDIPWEAEHILPGRVAYYLSDYWPSEPDVNEAYWRIEMSRDGFLGLKRFLANQVLRRLSKERDDHPLDFENTVFVSQAVQKILVDKGLQWARNGCVIYNGVDVKQFSPEGRSLDTIMNNLLFVGSLSPHKGLQTVLDALQVLVGNPEIRSVTLQIAGGGHEEHVRQIKQQIERLGLYNHVKLLGHVDRNQMSGLYSQAYALVFPSVWQEPLARSTQEAMACGLPIITTLTGGTAELVVDGVNGLTFDVGDSRGLAAQIKHLWADPALAKRLGKAARKTVEEKFDIELTTTQFENYLSKLIERSR